MYVIVGAGPCGLTLAYLLGRAGQRCIVVERETEIGGCHRVLRVNGRFTEHAPRVYLSSYVNMLWLFSQMGIRDSYTRYRFGILYLIFQVAKRLSIKESLYLFASYITLLFSPNFGQKTSVADWCCHFSQPSKDLLDRFCRFTDGAGSDRYSIYKLLQLADQNLLYQVLQPKLPNDLGIFPQIKSAIEATGNVSFRLGVQVDSIIKDNQRVTGVVVGGEEIPCTRVLLCIPPPALASLLARSSITFPGIGNLLSKSTYDVYVSATFHYDSEISFTPQWGFPQSEWGLVSIPIGNYFQDPRSKKVFSVTCIYPDRASARLQRTLNQTEDRQVVLEEMFQQLKESYPDLPRPDAMLLSPTAYYDGQKWNEFDSAFINTVEGEYLPAKSPIQGLYQIGTQNGNSSFAYTTFEAAVTNAMSWYNEYSGQRKIAISHPIKLSSLLWGGLVLYLVYRWIRARVATSGEKTSR